MPSKDEVRAQARQVIARNVMAETPKILEEGARRIMDIATDKLGLSIPLSVAKEMARAVIALKGEK